MEGRIILMHIEEIGYDGVGWIQGMGRRRALVNEVMNFLIPYRPENFMNR
jgi:hypothetical protein